METDYEQSRGERRSFYCSNSLWNEIKEACKDKCSISEFMKEGVKEKLKKNNLIIFFCIQTFYYNLYDLLCQEQNKLFLHLYHQSNKLISKNKLNHISKDFLHHNF